MSGPQQINAAAWRKYLEGLYATRSDRRSALALVLVIKQAADSMAVLRADLGDHSTTKALVAWDKRFASLRERVKLYLDDVPCANVSDAACDFGITGGVGSPAEQADAYAYEWAVRPILEGQWPTDYYMGQGHPAWPDAQETATLWNQLIEVQAVRDKLEDLPALGWPLGEWLTSVERELSSSAPGEEATLWDYLTEGADKAADLMSRAGNALLWGAGIAAGAFTLWVLRKVFR